MTWGLGRAAGLVFGNPMVRRSFFLVVAVGLAGCPEKPAPDAAVAAPAAEPPDAAVAQDAGLPADAGPPPLGELAIRLAAVLVDGGVVELAPALGKVELDAARSLELELGAPLTDYRVRLFDWADQIVPSDDTAHAADAGIAYRLVPVQPLRTGRRYSLVIDAQLGPQLTDALGRGYDDVRLELVVRGVLEPEPARPGKKPSKKRR